MAASLTYSRHVGVLVVLYPTARSSVSYHSRILVDFETHANQYLMYFSGYGGAQPYLRNMRNVNYVSIMHHYQIAGTVGLCLFQPYTAFKVCISIFRSLVLTR